MEDKITAWAVITVILLPISMAMFGALWRKVDKMPAAISEAIKQIEGTFKAALDGALGRIDKDQADQWNKINANDKELSNFKLDAEKRFAKEHDMQRLITDVRTDLHKIDEKLDFLTGTRAKPSRST